MSDGPPTIPPELQDVFAYEIHSKLLFAFLSGIYMSIVAFMMVHALVKPREKRKGFIITGLIFIQFVLTVCSIISGTVGIRSFVKDTFEEVYDSFNLPSVPGLLWTNIFVNIGLVIADVLIVWRCWKMWNRNTWIAAILGFLTVVEAGIKNYALYPLAVLAPLTDTDPRTPRVVAQLYAVDTAASFLGAAITLSASFLIILRIYMIGRGQGVRRFKFVIELVVESALLYSLPLLVIGILSVIGYPANAFTGVVAAFAFLTPGIAPALLVLRIHLGLARPDTMWEQPISAMWTRSHGAKSKAGTGEIYDSDKPDAPGVRNEAANPARSSPSAEIGEDGRLGVSLGGVVEVDRVNQP